MFGKSKKENEKVTIVTTKKQLKAAVGRKDSCIEVRGDLAEKMKWMAKLSKEKTALIIASIGVAAGAGVAAVAAAPITGGASMVGYAAASTAVGAASAGTLPAGAVALIAMLGGVAVVGILKGYDVIVEVDPLRIILKKNCQS